MNLQRTLVGRLFFGAGWCPVLIFLVHLVLSHLKAYEHWAPTDIFMHLLGGAGIAYCFHHSLKILQNDIDAIGFTAFVHYALTVSFTASATVFWEFGEFCVDKVLKTQVQRGLEDTLLDMALGIVGGVFTLSIFYCHDHLRNGGNSKTE